MNNNEELNILSSVNAQTEMKAYTKPELKKFGDLSELVQNNIGVGNDGFPLPDCTLS